MAEDYGKKSLKYSKKQISKAAVDAIEEYDREMARLWEERGGKPKGVDPWVETEGWQWWKDQDYQPQPPQKPLGNDPLSLLANETSGNVDYLKKEMSKVIDSIDVELSKSKPDFDRVKRLELEVGDIQDQLGGEYGQSVESKPKSGSILEPVRSNKTGKSGRLAKKAFEADPIRMVVETEAGGVPKQARTRSAHYLALENLAGKDAPFEVIDEMIDDPSTKYGFSTGRERFVSRKEMGRRITQEMPEAGILDENIYRAESEIGAHSGDVFDLEAKRHQTLDPEQIKAMTRRGTGPEADRELLRRTRGNKALAQLNKELADLTVESEYTREGNLKVLKRERKPTFKYSPYDVQVAAQGATPEANAARLRRIRDIHRRIATIKEGIAQSGPGAANIVGGGRRFGKLTNLARGIGKRGMKALGPLGWLSEPVSTAKAIADYASGDEARMLKATEYFQGLPEMSTGRGYTETEKREMEQSNLPWYDPRRRQGGV